MSIEAQIVQYRKEMVAQFEQKVSLLRACATKESVIAGNQATFLVAGANGDTAVTRGSNGQIPYSNPQNSQVTATLVEKHAPYELTNFNIFSSQGDQKRVMQQASMNVINRDIDLTMLAELYNATQTAGASATMSLDTILKSQAILGIADVDIENENDMFCVISPAAKSYLMQTTEFAHGDYADIKPFNGPSRKVWRWNGINWITSSRISGIGTATEYLYMFHRSAIGYAVNVGEESIMLGYDQKQDTSWSRATLFHGAKILQNSGIVKILHDGSAYVAS